MRGMTEKLDCESEKRGRLIRNGVLQYQHEAMTIQYFLARGEDVTLNVPTHVPCNRNPDFIMRGVMWEAKSPIINNTTSIQTTLKRASKQSGNVILDLRRLKGSENKLLKVVQNDFYKSRRLKRLLIIRKTGELLEPPTSKLLKTRKPKQSP